MVKLCSKSFQTNSTRLLCSRRRTRAPTATAPATPRVGRRRTSPAVLARRPYLPRSRVHFSSPSPSSRAWVETSSNRAIAGRRADHPRRSASIARTPSRFTSPRSSTTPSRARLSRSPAKSAPRTPRPPLLPPEASPLPSNSLSRPSSARFERAVRILATSSSSLTFSPSDSVAATSGTTPRRRGRANLRCSPSRSAPARARAPPPRASGPQGSPGRRAALPRCRLGPSPANQARHAAGNGPGGHGVAVLPVCHCSSVV